MTIDAYAFGEIRIDGTPYRSDVIIWPDRVKCPWWRGQGHVLAADDLAEVLAVPPRLLVIGTGYYGRMAVPRETLAALQDKDDLLSPGNPLYVPHQSEFRNLILLDTPDFDTGARGRYINRKVSQKALEASDILIYIFTNSNYNNRDNTDFISQMLTGIGRRKCFLIYRVYASFTEQEVHEHAMIVARGIYDDEADNYLLGIYRTDEDNHVAAGEKFMTLRPLRSRDPSFWEALESIDAHHMCSPFVCERKI